MTQFNNSASHCLFVGNRNLDEVIANDTQELQTINGSFEEIAFKMQTLADYALNQRRFPAEYDDKVSVLSFVTFRGMQECPFDTKCRINGYMGWNEEVRIKSKVNGRELTINSGTAHLARVHHLLEKDNQYGISAREFYEAFM